MKIREFTHKETLEIKNELVNRVVLTKEIHELLLQRFENAYEVYVRDFSYSLLSPLTFKPLNKVKFIDCMLGKYGGIGEVSVQKIVRYVEEDSFKYVFGTSYGAKFEFTNPIDLRIRALADYTRRYVLRDDDSLDYISILMDYAEVPFTLDLEDMKHIRLYRAQYQYIKKELGEIRNELHSIKQS